LISVLLTKFGNWDRFAEQAKFISVTYDLFGVVLAEASDEKVSSIAQTIGANSARDSMMFQSKEMTLAAFLLYLNNRCQYAGFGVFEYQNGGRNHVIIIQHAHGQKWSIFLHQQIDEVLRKPLGILAQFETNETSVVARFVT